MEQYDFRGLSDADFEDLVADLLNASLGVRFQMFSAGRDGGIDLLLGKQRTHGLVVQCKHYRRSGFSKLKASVANEVPKVKKLNPTRYVLATSVPLTPERKQELLEILSPYCLGLGDIYGLEDLNLLLRAHSQIETKHYKLWLTSVPVLHRVLRQGSILWNDLTRADIERKMSLYVQTHAYGIALGILQKYNYCVISGIPGIGKTTLAQVLTTRLLEDGFELITVRDDIRDAFADLDLSKRQVVYYDDFLGRSSLGERLGKNEDSGILRLLQEAKRSKHLKIILTTREYILNDARRLYEPLSGPELEIAKCIVSVEEYTRAHRARILYNHVYFSDLPDDYASALAMDRAYTKIIDHRNYNPRIVEWMTSNTGATTSAAFVPAFVAMLDNPLQIWEHAFDNQIGADAQLVLFCLASVVDRMELDDLRAVWEANLEPPDAGLARRARFQAALKLIDGSFVRTEKASEITAVSFHNPSVRDYVARRLVADQERLTVLCSRAVYFEQVDCLLRLGSDGMVQRAPARLLRDSLNLRAAISRTITAKSPLIHSRPTAIRSSAFWRPSTNIGARLSAVSTWAHVLGIDLLTFACALADQLLRSDKSAKVDSVSACSFVSSIVKTWGPNGGAVWSGLVKDLIIAIGKGVTDGTSSAEEWADWSEFISDHKQLFGEVEIKDWRDEIATFCFNEIDAIVENSDSASAAEGWFADVERAAEGWGIEIDEQRARLDAWIQSSEPSSDGDGDWEGGGGSSSGIDARSSDRDLDRLFNSLEGRER